MLYSEYDEPEAHICARRFDSSIVEKCTKVTVNLFDSTFYYCIFLFRISYGYFMIRAYEHQELVYNLVNEVSNLVWSESIGCTEATEVLK